LGQRVRIRWVGATWQLDGPGTNSYFEYGAGWAETPHDDGWWLDNIDITGVITAQVAPEVDPKPAPATACPTTAAGNCDENAAASDKGTVPKITIPDTNGNPTGTGPGLAAPQTEAFFGSGVPSAIPGGCPDGG